MHRIPNKDPKELQEVYFKCENILKANWMNFLLLTEPLPFPLGNTAVSLPVQLSFPTQSKIIFAVSSLENHLTLII